MTPGLTRRQVVVGLVGLLGTKLLPTQAAAEEERRALLRTKWDLDQEFLEEMVHATEVYTAKGPKPLPETVTFLYPGSGTDVSVLEIGVQLLYETPVGHTRFIFTEIGEYEEMDFAKENQWHEGYRDSIARIERALLRNKPRVFKSVTWKAPARNEWTNPAIPNSRVTEFNLPVPTRHGNKMMTLYFAYNTIVDREEPTEEEQQIFTKDLLFNARRGYWPKKKTPGKMYPTYFLQSQFDQADIVISKKSGDHGLLQFDYVRAFCRTAVVKPRVVFTESYETDNVIASLPDQTVQRYVIEPYSNWGYCQTSGPCHLEMLVV